MDIDNMVFERIGKRGCGIPRYTADLKDTHVIVSRDTDIPALWKAVIYNPDTKKYDYMGYGKTRRCAVLCALPYPHQQFRTAR